MIYDSHYSPGHSPASLGPRFVDGVRTAQSGVVIDWSDLPTGTDAPQQKVDELLSWISSYPRTSGIRVYLPSIAHRVSMQKLQRSLLSMGCTVTCRFTPSC